VILSLETHCCVEQQYKMAEIMIEIFGDMIQTPSEIDKRGITQYPSPNQLKHKILIKGKRVPVTQEEIIESQTDDDSDLETDSVIDPYENQEPDESHLVVVKSQPWVEPPKKVRHGVSLKLSNITYLQTMSYKGKFAEQWYKMHSFSENKLDNLCRNSTAKLISFNRSNFSRVYPKGTRFGSTNYDPSPGWFTGCQMIALNYQTNDEGMRQNHIKFEENGRCGYVLKPDRLRSKNLQVDYTQSVPTSRIVITIISAEHLPKPNETLKGEVIDPYIRLVVKGPGHDAKASFTTRTIWNNGFNPVWNQKFEFRIHHADLSMLQLTVFDKNSVQDAFICENVLAISKLRTGIRCVPLRNAGAKIMDACNLLIEIQISAETPALIEDDSVANTELIRSLQQENLRLKLHIERMQLDANVMEQTAVNPSTNTDDEFRTEMREEIQNSFKRQGGKLMKIEQQIQQMMEMMQKPEGENVIREQTKSNIAGKLVLISDTLKESRSKDGAVLQSVADINELVKSLRLDVNDVTEQNIPAVLVSSKPQVKKPGSPVSTAKTLKVKRSPSRLE
jgi:hypothetical protein